MNKEGRNFPVFSDSPIFTEYCSRSKEKISYSSTDSAVIVKSRTSSWNFLVLIKSVIRDIFLPKGYPESVSSDYLEYQIWDTCQAFCSSISSTLSMSAVMQGIGVGSKAATPVSAAMTWLLKDGTGMIGSILFAWLKGSKLDSDCKKWRLFADVLNDVALFIELYIPFVMQYSWQMLCMATAFKAVVGTAGSSTRTAIITHQALKGNIADVSAKDGSQEIFTNLCAFIFGIFMLPIITETKQIWSVMCTATLFHLIFNYKAVSCLKINVFNNERLCLSLRTYLPTSSVPSVEQISRRESVFLFMGMREVSVCGYSIAVGVSLKEVVKSKEMTSEMFLAITSMFQHKNYLIMPVIKKKKLYVALKKKFTDFDILKAYFHACLIGLSINYLQKAENLNVLVRGRKNSPIFRLKNILNVYFDAEYKKLDSEESVLMEALISCEDFTDKEFSAFCESCENEGWVIDTNLLNTDDWRGDWSHKQPRNIHFTSDASQFKSHTSLKSQKNSRKPPPNKMSYLIIS